MQEEAHRRGLGRAKFVYLVMDGAVWLWDLAKDRFANAIKTLDFHHAREHLQAIADALHGAGSDQAGAWLKPLLHSLRQGQEQKVVGNLEDLLSSAPPDRSAEVQENLEREVNYFQTHRDLLHYQTMEKAGAPLGSGAVESLGNSTRRLGDTLIVVVIASGYFIAPPATSPGRKDASTTRRERIVAVAPSFAEFSVAVFGRPGITYRVEHSSNLTSNNWQVISNAPFAVPGRMLTLPATGSGGFYRASEQ